MNNMFGKPQYEKFQDSRFLANGSERATVEFNNLKTLWFNTGTLCNIECENCYILSSPKNDALVYISLSEVMEFINESEVHGWPLQTVGFTGGEPFMNPEIIQMSEFALKNGYEVMILTNAMRPMMRSSIRKGLEKLHGQYGNQLILRISLDHWSEELHDRERGRGSFAQTLEGMKWLRDQGIQISVAGRTIWGDSESDSRNGYRKLFAEHSFNIDSEDFNAMVLFPEMDNSIDVPEISTDCWNILGKSPQSVMCASSRMVVKRKGAKKPVVIACTLLPYDTRFQLGETLEEARCSVSLNHPHCSKFCVLGGGSCSG